MARDAAKEERLTQADLALMTAFEAGDPSAAEPPLSEAQRFELDELLALTSRIAEVEDVAPVSPAVRSAVLSAAVAQTQAAAEPSGLARWLMALLRPAPMAAIGVAAAVALAVAVRPDTAPEQPAAEPAMVAMDRPATPKPVDEAPAMPAAKAAAPAAPPPAARPRRTFAAKPASLGPQTGAEVPNSEADTPIDDRDDALAARGAADKRAAKVASANKATRRRRSAKKPVRYKVPAEAEQVAVKDLPAKKQAAPAPKAPPQLAKKAEVVDRLLDTKQRAYRRPVDGTLAAAAEARDEDDAAPTTRTAQANVAQVWKEREAKTARYGSSTAPAPSAPRPAPAPRARQAAPAPSARQAAPGAVRAPATKATYRAAPREDAAREQAEKAPQSNLSVVRAQLAKAKTDAIRRAVLVRARKQAQASGDKATLAWVTRQLKALDAKASKAAASKAKR